MAKNDDYIPRWRKTHYAQEYKSLTRKDDFLIWQLSMFIALLNLVKSCDAEETRVRKLFTQSVVQKEGVPMWERTRTLCSTCHVTVNSELNCDASFILTSLPSQLSKLPSPTGWYVWQKQREQQLSTTVICTGVTSTCLRRAILISLTVHTINDGLYEKHPW